MIASLGVATFLVQLLLLLLPNRGAASFVAVTPPSANDAVVSNWGRRRRASHLAAASDGTVVESVALADDEDSTARRKSSGRKRISVLVCPAQFCVPDDYDVLFENLANLAANEEAGVDFELGAFRVAPLPRTEWIKVAKQLPTAAFLEAKLPVLQTLRWYFDAIETALAEIFAEEQQRGEAANICVIGHSIGGWVARAYLGSMSLSSTAVHKLAIERCSSFITLGTPHISPDDALVDQTRGLLRAIAETPSCQPQALADKGIEVTCVASSGLKGKFATTNIEEIVAASSYLPLLGRVDENTEGDGIVPLDLAFMDPPSRRVVVDECFQTNAPVRHAHVVPTPWNLLDGSAPSIKLPADKYPSYISQGVLEQWAKYIR